MNYYIPSYRNHSRINFRRKRNKKPFLFCSLLLTLVFSYFILDFDSKTVLEDSSVKHEKSPVQVASPVPDQTEQAAVKTPQDQAALDNKPAVFESAEQSVSKPAAIAEPLTFLDEKTVTISSGDTLMRLLVRNGLETVEAHNVITALQQVFNPRRIRQGHEITLAFENTSDRDPVFQQMNLRLDVTRSVQVERCSEKGFTATETIQELGSRLVRAEAEITSSLYNAAVSAGIPVDVLMQMIRAYSFDVDFQRDIQPGDTIAILFEEKINENGEFVRGGSTMYASLNTRGRDLAIYRYETTDGEVDFFNPKGQSVRKTLMVTPIDGARLTSGYGKRRHPILGYSRMHRGLDFAAPTGTPIMAAGDGIVEYAGRKGNYGNYIRLRHPNEYHTVYAHMSRFASGIRSGVRVRQGETIGYVGSTGMSTGPHLHYEVHYRGNHVNPRTVDTPPGRTLKGDELSRFHAARNDLEVLFASLESREKLARLDLRSD